MRLVALVSICLVSEICKVNDHTLKDPILGLVHGVEKPLGEISQAQTVMLGYLLDWDLLALDPCQGLAGSVWEFQADLLQSYSIQGGILPLLGVVGSASPLPNGEILSPLGNILVAFLPYVFAVETDRVDLAPIFQLTLKASRLLGSGVSDWKHLTEG